MTEETPPPVPPGDSSPSPFASPWFIAAAGFVAALVIMGLVVTMTTLMSDDSSDHPPQTQSSGQSPGAQEGKIGEEEYPDEVSPSEVPRSDGSQSVCGLPPGDATEFTGWPAATSWEIAGLVEAPTTTAHGPGEIEDSGYRHCYAKSPTGAVFAGMNYIAMTSDPSIRPDMVKHMLAEGEGKQALLEELEEHGSGSDPRILGHIGGVKLLSYADDRARVEVAMIIQASEEATVATTVDLRWEDGDWKIVTREDGEMIIPQVVIHSLEGYVLTPQEAED